MCDYLLSTIEILFIRPSFRFYFHFHLLRRESKFLTNYKPYDIIKVQVVYIKRMLRKTRSVVILCVFHLTDKFRRTLDKHLYYDNKIAGKNKNIPSSHSHLLFCCRNCLAELNYSASLFIAANKFDIIWQLILIEVSDVRARIETVLKLVGFSWITVSGKTVSLIIVILVNLLNWEFY